MVVIVRKIILPMAISRFFIFLQYREKTKDIVSNWWKYSKDMDCITAPNL